MSIKKAETKPEAKDDDGIVKANPTVVITSPISGSTIGGTVTVWGTYADAPDSFSITCELWDGENKVTYSVAMTDIGTWSADLTVLESELESPRIGLEIRAKFTNTNYESAVNDLTYEIDDGGHGIFIDNPGEPVVPPPSPLLVASAATALQLKISGTLLNKANRLSAVHTLYICKGKVLGEPVLAKRVGSGGFESLHRIPGGQRNNKNVSLVVIGHQFNNRGILHTTSLSWQKIDFSEIP